MPDNVVLHTAAGGDSIAADALGGSVKHQQVLVEFGAAGTATRVDSTHPLPICSGKATGRTVTRVNASLTNVTLKALNNNRGRLMVYNEPTNGNLYLKYGATATVTDYTLIILPGQYWEMPDPVDPVQVDGIWVGAIAGAAQVTEVTN
jgi:hypothetical protein